MLAHKSKPTGNLVTAFARELVGFVWAIGTETERQFGAETPHEGTGQVKQSGPSAATEENPRRHCVMLTAVMKPLVELRRGLVEDRVRLTKRITSALKSYFPQLLDWFRDKGTAVVADFLER